MGDQLVADDRRTMHGLGVGDIHMSGPWGCGCGQKSVLAGQYGAVNANVVPGHEESVFGGTTDSTLVRDWTLAVAVSSALATRSVARCAREQ